MQGPATRELFDATAAVGFRLGIPVVDRATLRFHDAHQRRPEVDEVLDLLVCVAFVLEQAPLYALEDVRRFPFLAL